MWQVLVPAMPALPMPMTASSTVAAGSMVVAAEINSLVSILSIVLSYRNHQLQCQVNKQNDNN
jgi:hypothetical protein